MTKQGIWSKVSPTLLGISQGLRRACIRGLAVVAIVTTYGVTQGLGVVGITGLTMGATTTSADAGWRGRGWGRRGWGRRGWRRGWR